MELGVKTYIERNPNGDTRTADHVPTMGEFVEANSMHISSVCNMMANFSLAITGRGRKHDWTKTSEPHKSLFYRELCSTIEGKMKFKDGEWYPMHCKEERHHLNECCPEDVNLIDVLEMLCDCVCAGMGRSGSYTPVNLDSEILERAFRNTEKMLLDSVVLR